MKVLLLTVCEITIDIITITGIGNGSISHDLYLGNLCERQNSLKYIRVMPLPTSCFRVGSLLVYCSSGKFIVGNFYVKKFKVK